VCDPAFYLLRAITALENTPEDRLLLT
jgi:hypothetical protein